MSHHLGDPCIHCGVSHDVVPSSDCPNATGEAAQVRVIEYVKGLQADLEKKYLAENTRLNAMLGNARTTLSKHAAGLDVDKITLAETILYVGDFAKGGTDRASAVQDAIKWFATGKAGYRGLQHEYFGTKSYDRWHGQRCDCEYGMGPRHGSIIFRIELSRDARNRDLTAEEKDAAIYYLVNIQAIQTAAKEAGREDHG